MFYALLSRHVDETSPVIEQSYMRLTPKAVSKNGVMSKSFVFESYDPSSDLSKFSVNDFKIENIIAVGAYDMLKPKSMTDVNPLSVIDRFESDLSNSLNSLGHVSEKTS